MKAQSLREHFRRFVLSVFVIEPLCYVLYRRPTMLIVPGASICSIIDHSPLQPTTSACFENVAHSLTEEKPRGVLGLSKKLHAGPSSRNVSRISIDMFKGDAG